MSTNGLLNGHHDGDELALIEDSADPPSIYKASSVAEIQATLGQLNDREASVTARLNALVASQKDLSRELGRLDLLRARLGSQVVTTRSISNGMLSNAASTANRISSAVKRLDLEQSRVKATLEVVEQVSELKACVLGVIGSMGAPQDWETAAGYLSRASKIPEEIVKGRFAEEVVPTAEVPDPPSVTLESAAESLCGLFLREFEKAAKENDGAKVTRFFKLFPLIGRSDVGLDIYGRYVCQGVASRARANLNAGTGGQQRKDTYFYANALTKLFEHIAQIVDGHGALVERHYGAGRMIKVIERLQVEADVQGGIILDTWSDERNIDRRLTDIKSYAFSFLVQSFLSVPRASSGTPRSNSPAVRDGSAAPRTSEDEGVDMKEVDGFLGEMALMLGRWSLYSSFLANKCKAPMHENDSSETEPLQIPMFLSNSTLNKKITDRLVSPFNSMTTFFFRRSVEKAFQLDESPSDLSLHPTRPFQSNPPFITSALDDVMYIVNQVLQRSLATSQRGVVSGVVPTLGRVLSSDFIGMIQRKMRDESYPKAAIQGAPPPEDKVVAFCLLLNNLDVATDYIKRIISSQLDRERSADEEANPGNSSGNASLTDLFPFNHDSAFVANLLNSMLQTFTSKTGELLSDGIHVTFDRVVKPRLRPILADAFRDIDYDQNAHEGAPSHRQQRQAYTDADDIDPDSEEAAAQSSGDSTLVQRRFAASWSALMHPLRRLLTDPNWNRLLAATASYIGGPNKLLEKRIWGYYGRMDELGAVRLERDVAAIVGVIVSSGGRYGLRDAFTRCLQIMMVVNMEEDEWAELVEAEADGVDGDVEWRLGPEERARAKAMIRDTR
ncbi:MAG: High affinity Ca2+/Mn2+ P-type ATPase-like protein [Chaenotheca gracillima]|nr:MAG: High affinity Ca2+/Mn2+ P-type ATPase-like protein [Chaenotheca gracillima]